MNGSTRKEEEERKDSGEEVYDRAILWRHIMGLH